MTDRWTESLSEYLDGELVPEDRRELGLHLESCADCAQTLRELEQVVERARALPDRAPEHDLWSAIEARITGRAPAVTTIEPARIPERLPEGASRRPRSVRRASSVVSFTWPQLVAAGLAVALLASAAFWLGTRGDRRMASSPTSSPAEPGTKVAVDQVPNANEAAIEELRDALARGRQDLDPQTVKVLEQNLGTIERSIHEAKAALDADPANPYLRRHLQETMTRKVNLLRQATFLASAP
jgi:anti-sigma factor RsiW